MRLDKFLSLNGYGSRKTVKELIRKGRVSVNGNTIKNDDHKIDENIDEVFIFDNNVEYKEYKYFMLNKPKGYLSAARDSYHQTVMDLIFEDTKNLFLVGRLDIDTEGLLLITNNGQLAHKLLSPKNEITKKYYVEFEGSFLDEYYQNFEEGIILEDGYKTKPATIKILKKGTCYLSIHEGKFHQVKRMFKALKMEVKYLKRVAFGSLELDQSLKLGEYRELTEEEIRQL
ncbi:rRNA pseudouridine synthase [Acholeplasma sp. OttesenSCG-928-E16]|nr:rRNA pseudouridine synthase [Acholeplasma sp. OttesenSCG-928-E16]